MLLKTGREVYPDAAEQYREVPVFRSKRKIWRNERVSLFFLPEFAQMVKLVDTLVSGTSGRKAVQVRVLFWAQVLNQKSEIRNLELISIFWLQISKLMKKGAGGEIGRHATLRG